MTPLCITARLLEGLVVRHPIHLDSLLDGAYCARDGILLAPARLDDVQVHPLPLQRSACGRFWLCSVGEYVPVEQELRFKNRRAPWVEYARLGNAKITRVQINFGANKSYRVPYEFTIPDNGVMRWWARGERDEVLSLLHIVHYLGKYRNAGKGKIANWDVEPCESWDGFPVWRDGSPLRNMPVASGAVGALLRCDSPYWMREGRVPCLAPALP